MAKIKVTQVKSQIGRLKNQKRTLEALGLRRLNQTVEHEATPSIIGMVIQESILITTIAGYLGLSLGTYILSAIGDSLEKYFIKDPSVSPGIVIGATIILILSGLIAGYLPAKKAAQIKPIVALRAD